MNTVTDDELIRLLARTFDEHESLATTDGLANAVELGRRGPSRRRPLWLVAAAAAVLVGVAGIGWVAGLPDARTTQSPGVSTSAGLTSRASEAELRAATEQAVEDAVQAVRMPAGAEEFPRGEALPDHSDPPAVASKGRYWSVPGTVDSVTAALVDNPPPGLSGSVDAGPTATSRSVQYWNPAGSTAASAEVTTRLTVGATDRADEVRVLAWAESTPRPARPASSFIDDRVESIDVTLIRPDATGASTSVQMTLTDRAGIDQVVAALNGTFAMNKPIVKCAPGPLIEDRALIHTASRDVGLVLNYSCPSGVHFTDSDTWLEETAGIASVLGNALGDFGVTLSPTSTR